MFQPTIQFLPPETELEIRAVLKKRAFAHRYLAGTQRHGSDYPQRVAGESGPKIRLIKQEWAVIFSASVNSKMWHFSSVGS